MGSTPTCGPLTAVAVVIRQRHRGALSPRACLGDPAPPLGWTLQRPERRARERDEQAITQWVQRVAPDQKGRPQNGLDRLLRRIGRLADPTGAPHLVTPRPHPDPAPPLQLEEGLDGRRAGLRPDGSAPGSASMLQQPSYNTDRLIGVLEQLGLLRRPEGDALWDGLSAHWSNKMRAWLDSQRGWLTAERLPAYAPELNPVECLWDARIDVKWRGAPRSRPGWRGRPRGPGSASRTG